MVLQQPSIEILGITVAEPVTTLTDLLVSVVCFYAFMKLMKMQSKDAAHRHFMRYFFLMGLATLFGGLMGHGFLYAFQFDWQNLPDWFINTFSEKYAKDFGSQVWKLPGWIISMFSVSYLERASIAHSRPLMPNGLAKSVKIANYVELFTFMIITMLTLNFFFIEVHSAFGILFITGSLQLFIFYQTRTKASRYVLIAVGISALSALIFMNEWGISKWFNHLDISHVLMSIGIYFTYLGAKNLKMSEVKKKV